MEVALSRFLLVALATFISVSSAPVDDHSVAFSVGLSNTQHLNDDETVKYNKVFLNLQSGYSTSTGVFTAPVAGVYVFHFHAYSTNKDAVMWLELLHNDALTVSLSGYNSHTVASNTVILKLRQNDRVEVRSKEQQQFSLFGLPDQVYSTFAGYLLSPDSTGAFMDSGDLVG